TRWEKDSTPEARKDSVERTRALFHGPGIDRSRPCRSSKAATGQNKLCLQIEKNQHRALEWKFSWRPILARPFLHARRVLGCPMIVALCSNGLKTLFSEIFRSARGKNEFKGEIEIRCPCHHTVLANRARVPIFDVATAVFRHNGLWSQVSPNRRWLPEHDIL